MNVIIFIKQSIPYSNCIQNKNVFNWSCRASLVSSQQEVVSQSEIINALSRDLAQAHARLSDMTGAAQLTQYEINML